MDFDTTVRLKVYERVVESGRVPSIAEVAQSLSVSGEQVRAAVENLAQGHMLVLQDSGEILMAPPFSAVPTPFVVEAGGRAWWAPCMWDALGVPVALQRDAHIFTACGCCGHAMHVSIRDGVLQPAEGIIHFALPARDWWKNIVFT